MVSALAAKVSPFGMFETRRLVNALFGIAGLAATWQIGRRLGGPVAGLMALLLLAACPVYDGHMYINAKDTPFAAAMTILLWSLVRMFDEYPAPSRRSVVFVGVALGLAFGSRILAIVLGLGAAIALLVIVVEEVRERRDALQRLLQFIWLMLPALLIGYLIMGLLWPWSVTSPLNPLYASDYFSGFFEKPWRELFQGRLIYVPDMPWTYLPQMFAIKLPVIMSALGLLGTVWIIAAGMRGRLPINRGGALFVVIMAAFLPILIAMVARPALYNGIRHFLFVIPPFAVLGGLAGAGLFEWARERRPTIRDRRHRGALRRPRLAGERHRAAAPVPVFVFQLGVGRRRDGPRQIHARLLGARLQTGERSITRASRRDRAEAAGRPALGRRDLRAAARRRSRARQ